MRVLSYRLPVRVVEAAFVHRATLNGYTRGWILFKKKKKQCSDKEVSETVVGVEYFYRVPMRLSVRISPAYIPRELGMKVAPAQKSLLSLSGLKMCHIRRG